MSIVCLLCRYNRRLQVKKLDSSIANETEYKCLIGNKFNGSRSYSSLLHQSSLLPTSNKSHFSRPVATSFRHVKNPANPSLRFSSDEKVFGRHELPSELENSNFKALLEESQVSESSPLENESFVNLDEFSGHYNYSISPKTPKRRVSNSERDNDQQMLDHHNTAVSYCSKSAYLFPGALTSLNSAFVEVISREPVSKEVFDEASGIVGLDLLQLYTKGSKETLNSARYKELLTFVTSMAELRWLCYHKPLIHDNLIMAGGIGVGEISALVAVGALPFQQATNLIKIRGELMEEACSMCESGLAFVVGSRVTKFNELCAKLNTIAQFSMGNISTAKTTHFTDSRQNGFEENFTTSSSSVAVNLYQCTKLIATNSLCLSQLHKLKKEFDIKSVSQLNSCPLAYHSPFLKPVEEEYWDAICDLSFNDPYSWSPTVYSNVTGSRYRNSDFTSPSSVKAKKLLLKQLTSTSKWETIVNRMAQKIKDATKTNNKKDGDDYDYPQFYELGPGTFLTKTLKQINNQAAKRCTDLKHFINIVEKRPGEDC